MIPKLRCPSTAREMETRSLTARVMEIFKARDITCRGHVTYTSKYRYIHVYMSIHKCMYIS